MEWEDREESSNVEDRRSMGPAAKAGIAAGGGGLLILLIALVFGVDPKQLTQILGPPKGNPDNKQRRIDPEEERQAKFTRVILKDTEDVWNEQFKKVGKRYVEPKLVLFTGSVQSGCGFASAQVGPFYCPADSRLYIDLSFFKVMEKQLGARGEFARAYVVAHEVGHHIQNLLGYSRLADEKRKTALENQYSVRLELQADYLAGVWAHYIQQKYKDKYDVLNEKDIEAGLKAAIQIGDDTLGHTRPEKFTHGSGKARSYWLGDGMRTGDFSKKKLDAFFTLPYNEVDIGQSKRRR